MRIVRFNPTSWSPLTGADSYTIKRSDVSGGPYLTIASNLTATSSVDAELAAGRHYSYTASAALTAGGETANADIAAPLSTWATLATVVGDETTQVIEHAAPALQQYYAVVITSP